MIRLLSPSLQNQIAAGEVVERPSSVIKELVENSIDAQATDVRIFIEEGGLSEIRIVDNGKGMTPEDAVLSFERYATSKITTADDLFSLSSFGFRGEAMAAIASVSHCIVRTMQAKDTHGTQVINAQNPTPIGCAVGTEIIVQNLFWNVPVRKKFIKSTETETRECIKMVEQFALSHPHISFRLESNGKMILNIPVAMGEDRLLHRCKKILGESISPLLLPLHYLGGQMQISGFCSHSSLHRSTKDKQYFFVNGRMIHKDSIFGACIAQAYQSLLPSGKHPVVLLSLVLPPDMVDVNVHPRKLEVKFAKPSEVFHIIKSSLEKGLQQPMAAPEAPSLQEKNSSFVSSVFSAPSHAGYHFPKHAQKFSNIPFPQSQSMQVPFFETEKSAEHTAWKIIGQSRNSFIIVEESNGIRIIDQHAAHERVRYEKLMADIQQKQVVSQPLLTPCVLSLSSVEKSLILEHRSELQEYGFEIEDFGENDIAVLCVPAGSENIILEELFHALLEDLDFFDPAFGKTLQKPLEKIISYAACRGAKKFGDRLSVEEMEALVRDWKACKTKDACAHGRRVSVLYLFQDIENECGRY